MNRVVFFDTGAFIALTNQADQSHLLAKNCLLELSSSRASFVTSNFVLDETYTRLRRRAGSKVAIEFGEKIQAGKEIKIIFIDRTVEKRAWDIFKKYQDQRFSYTDCTSFALMEARKIREAFAFDKDFAIFGFQTIPRN